MAKKFKVGEDNNDEISQGQISRNETTVSPIAEADTINALPQDENNDPNAIKVTIEDEKTPIVVLFGPPSSGKTMILVRMTRYLRKIGFNVKTVPTFRSSEDEHYKKICDGFNEMITNENAAESTSAISFMLLKVWKKGKPICQILETPGEHCFNPNDKSSNMDFPRYFQSICNNNNRKIFLIVVEPDWRDESHRTNYVQRINQLIHRMGQRDKAIFLYNKVDETPFVIMRGKTNTAEAKKSVSDQYKGIFESFKNTIPIVNFFTPYNCKFVPFSTGDYNKTVNGDNVYEEGPDEYPRELWKTIMSFVRG